MTEREALLLAIRDAPKDRTPLLAYADMIDENPHWPAATASAELIRLACSKPSRVWITMPPWCSDWLVNNWKRLIPSVLTVNVPITEPSERWAEAPPGGIFVALNCSEIATYITLPGRVTHQTRKVEKLYSCRLVLTLGFGRIRRWEMQSAFGQETVGPLLNADQPQLFLPCPPPTHDSEPRKPPPEVPPDTRTLAFAESPDAPA